MRVYLGLTLAIVLSLSTFGAQVSLKNGDRVTGKIVKKDGDSLLIKTDLMGDITLKWADVTELKSDEPLYVVLPGDMTVKGPVAVNAGKVEVCSQNAPVAEVKAIRNPDEQSRYDRYLRPPIYDLWAGFLDLGLAAARGNSKTTTFTTSFNATRVTSGDKLRLSLNQIYATGTVKGKETETARAIRGGWGYDRNIGKRIFLDMFNDYEYDAFQNLDLRFVAGAGAGIHLYKGDRGILDVLGGASYNREMYGVPLTTGQTRRSSGEAYWGDDFAWKLNGITSLKQAFRTFNNLSNTGEYRMNFDLGTETKLRKWLSWQISFSDRYVTNPAPDRKTNDLLITSGIRFTFAQ